MEPRIGAAQHRSLLDPLPDSPHDELTINSPIPTLIKPMKILAIISQKGGVGKTTVATSLAVAAELAGQRVALFDLDDQASAAFWGGLREKRGVVTPVIRDVKMALLERDLERARNAEADLVILDCPPVQGAAITAANHADFVLIPTKTDILDIRSMRSTVALMQSINKRLSVVLTFCPPIGAEVDQARQLIAGLGAELAPVEIHQRKAYARAQQDGQTVQEYEPTGKAAAEVTELYSYIHKHLHGKAHGKATAKAKSARGV
jgi:chromosome partitioning protein